jgi:hypothetical protein
VEDPLTIDECLGELLAQLTAVRTDNKVTVLEANTVRLLAAVNAAAAKNHIACNYNPLWDKKGKSK